MKKCGLRAFNLGGPVDPLGNDFDRINAERSARWAMDDTQNAMKYATDPMQAQGLNAQLVQQNKGYQASFGQPTRPMSPMGQSALAQASQAEDMFASQMKKILGFRQGGTVGVDPRGFIQGPGGVDNVPARVAETGEEIRVGTGERIVNKDQNAALEALAAQAGMTLDEYLASATGEPVGPTMKQGLRGLAQGGFVGPQPLLDDEVRARAEQARLQRHAAATSVDAPGRAAPVQKAPSKLAGLAASTAMIAPPIMAMASDEPTLSGKLREATGIAPKLSREEERFAPGKFGVSARSLFGEQPVRPQQPAPQALPQSDPSYDRKEFRSAAGNIVARQEMDNPNIAGLRAAGVTGGVQGDVTENGRTPSTGIRTIDTQNGKVYAGRDVKGQLVVNSNVNPGGLAASDAARDKEFAAKGYGKDAYGHWMTPQRMADKQSLEQMQRDRAQFAAFSDQITDPKARAAGLRRVTFDMANDAQGAKRAQENAKLRLEAAKYDQDERKIANLQGNSDREFGQKVGEANAKRLDDYIKAKATVDGKLDGEKYAQMQAFAGNFESNHKVGSNAHFKALMDELGVQSAFTNDKGSVFRGVRGMGSDAPQGLRQQDGLLWGKYLQDPVTQRRVSFSDLAKMSPSEQRIAVSRVEDPTLRTELLKKLGIADK